MLYCNHFWLCKCYAVIVVSDPPKNPIILKTGARKSVRVGSELSVTCESAGGNPRPQLAWFKNDVQEEASENSPNLPGRHDASSTLAFVPRASDNGAVLKCEASNKLMPRAVAVQTVLDVQCRCCVDLALEMHTVVLQVGCLLAVGPPTAKLDGPVEIKPETFAELTCVSGSSNPASEITWTINGKPYPEKSGRVQPAANGKVPTDEK